jgi:hypothetical protein
MNASVTLTQEQEEQLALDQFRGVSGLLPGNDQRVVPDPPDFVVTNGAHRTSVEMTRYHKDAEQPGGSVAARHEGNEQQLAARAQAIFEAVHPDLFAEVRPYIVHGVLSKQNLNNYAALLAEAVAVLMPSAPSEAEPLTTVDVAPSQLLDEKLTDVITHLVITRSRSLRRHAWLVGSGGYMNTDTADLESRIRSKERDLGRYREQFDQCWLLVYAMPQASAFFDFEVLRPGMFMSDFDAVGFIDVFAGRFVMIAQR